MKRKSNKKAWDALKQKQSDYLIQAGWFEESKYDDGTPVGGIAAIQNYGAKIPVTDKMRGFFRYQFGINLKKSTNYIIIPPTHFWENCINKNKEKWFKLSQNLWQQFFSGNIKSDTVAETFGSTLEIDIVKELANGSYPPVTRFTLTQKLSKYKDTNTEGQLGQRFQTKDHIMIDSVSHKVTKQ